MPFFICTRFHTRVAYRIAYFFPLSNTFFDVHFFSLRRKSVLEKHVKDEDKN
jgi:hypothetical protein